MLHRPIEITRITGRVGRHSDDDRREIFLALLTLSCPKESPPFAQTKFAKGRPPKIAFGIIVCANRPSLLAHIGCATREATGESCQIESNVTDHWAGGQCPKVETPLVWEQGPVVRPK